MAQGSKHKPTDDLRMAVRIHMAVGSTQEQLCQILDIDVKTLRKHYRSELDTGLASANAAVGGALYNKATKKGGNVAAQIFWLKTRAGFVAPKEAPKPARPTRFTYSRAVAPAAAADA